jgi:hypothetical protein
MSDFPEPDSGDGSTHSPRVLSDDEASSVQPPPEAPATNDEGVPLENPG